MTWRSDSCSPVDSFQTCGDLRPVEISAACWRLIVIIQYFTIECFFRELTLITRLTAHRHSGTWRRPDVFDPLNDTVWSDITGVQVALGWWLWTWDSQRKGVKQCWRLSVTSVLLVSVSLSVSVSTPLFVLSGPCRPLLLRLPLLCCR